MNSRFLLFLLMGAFVVLRAEEVAPEIIPLAAKFKTDLEAFEEQHTAEVARLSQVYIAALDAAEAHATAGGNVKAGEAITAERDSVKTLKIRDAVPADLPKTLHSARKSFMDGLGRTNKDYAARQEKAKGDYLRALSGLELKARGNAVLAAQLALEKEKVLRDITATSPAGILVSHFWTLGYETWEFAPNGKLIQRQPSPPAWSGKTWRYTANKRAVECVFEDGKTGAYPFEEGHLYHWDKKLGEFTKEPLK